MQSVAKHLCYNQSFYKKKQLSSWNNKENLMGKTKIRIIQFVMIYPYMKYQDPSSSVLEYMMRSVRTEWRTFRGKPICPLNFFEVGVHKNPFLWLDCSEVWKKCQNNLVFFTEFTQKKNDQLSHILSFYFWQIKYKFDGKRSMCPFSFIVFQTLPQWLSGDTSQQLMHLELLGIKILGPRL